MQNLDLIKADKTYCYYTHTQIEGVAKVKLEKNKDFIIAYEFDKITSTMWESLVNR